MRLVSEIKLIRTDTTLDLSQKAEKVCFEHVAVLAECGTGVVQSYDWNFACHDKMLRRRGSRTTQASMAQLAERSAVNR